MKQVKEGVPCLQTQSSFMIPLTAAETEMQYSYCVGSTRTRPLLEEQVEPEGARRENKSGHDQVALQSAWECWLVLHGHSHAGSPQLRNWCSHLDARQVLSQITTGGNERPAMGRTIRPCDDAHW